MDKYSPPYEITNKMLGSVAEIMEALGKLSGVNDLEKLPRLRRVSRIKSIHSSLAIENNTLSVKQVTDVIGGKRVLAPENDIKEVKNAYLAYKNLGNIDPYSIKDLLNTHKTMMDGLVEQAGELRTNQVGVYNEKGELIHMAPPSEFVPEHIENLFSWTKENPANMLIKSSIFHYEFEFIHPFRDGNGRMGRLWQTALLCDFKPIFACVPIESIIKDNQEEYYNAIRLSTSLGKSTTFIEFMLDVINKALKDIINDTEQHYRHISTQISDLMNVIESYPQSTTELMQKLELKSRNGFRTNYILPALDVGLIAMTEPDKPTSKNQKYYKI